MFQVKPRVTIKGIRAEPGQVRIPPKTSTLVEKKKVPPSVEVQEDHCLECKQKV